jgi:hydroxymethylpyrimidine pyrophosphatase-like HAD family hydrolase
MWINYLRPIIKEYGENELLDSDDVDNLVNIIKAKINLHEGNITEEEYDNILNRFTIKTGLENSENTVYNNLKESKNKKGESISPILPVYIKNYLIDIDGTICDDIPNEEPERMVTANVFTDALEILNKWYGEGHIITFFTSRTEEHRQVTETWLNKHGFRYHGLLMGKPRGGNYHWIDNHIVRATRYEGKFTDLVIKNKKIETFNH